MNSLKGIIIQKWSLCLSRRKLKSNLSVGVEQYRYLLSYIVQALKHFTCKFEILTWNFASGCFSYTIQYKRFFEKFFQSTKTFSLKYLNKYMRIVINLNRQYPEHCERTRKRRYNVYAITLLSSGYCHFMKHTRPNINHTCETPFFLKTWKWNRYPHWTWLLSVH